MVNYKQFYTNNKPVSGKTKCCEEEQHNAVDCSDIIPQKQGDYLKTKNYLSEYSYSSADRERVLENLGIDSRLGLLDDSVADKIRRFTEEIDDRIGALNILRQELNEKALEMHNELYDRVPIYTSDLLEVKPKDIDKYLIIPSDSDLDGDVTNNTATSINGTYLDILFKSLKALQSEVARLRNSFRFGINSFQNYDTALSQEINEEDLSEEPLWAVDPEALSFVDSLSIDEDHGLVGGVIRVLNKKVEVIGESRWYSQDLTDISDTKIVIYLTCSNSNVKIILKDQNNQIFTLNLESIINSQVLQNIMIIISRETESGGKNYIYITADNYNLDQTIVQGYYNGTNELQTSPYYIDENYQFQNIYFRDLEIYKLNTYSKYQDFSNQIIPSKPNDNTYKYEAAHITIRSVETYNVLLSISKQLQDSELVYCKATKKLYIIDDGKIQSIGGFKEDEETTDDQMTKDQLINELKQLGIVTTTSGQLELSKISDITFINNDTNDEFNVTIDPYGQFKIDKVQKQNKTLANRVTGKVFNEWEVRGFVGTVNGQEHNNNTEMISFDVSSDYGLWGDRVKLGAIYAPLNTDKIYGCSHCFIELENTSTIDFPLDGCYLHYYEERTGGNDILKHLKLSGYIPGGGTYLIRCAKCANSDDPNVFINVNSYDIEWYENGELLRLNSNASLTTGFALTYGLPELAADYSLLKIPTEQELTSTYNINIDSPLKSFQYLYKNGFIDGLYIGISKKDTSGLGYWAGGSVMPTKSNSIYKNTFELDPAKQAFQSTTKVESSRFRWEKSGTDYQQLSLANKYIRFPKSDDIYPISKFTPKASFEHKNVCTDKTQLDVEKPNMVTCSFGINIYTTRCFNWISGGLFDEYVFIKQGNNWIKFESYKEGDGTNDFSNNGNTLTRKEFSENIINCIYKRITKRFPAANTQYTAHKCIINIISPTKEENGQIVANYVTSPTTYTYVVGRADKNGNPDPEHCSEEYTFTLYPEDYIPVIYQITDQQGFHWIEYQVWAAAANVVNQKINNGEVDKYTDEEANEYNATLPNAISTETELTSEQVTTLNALQGTNTYNVGSHPTNEDTILYNSNLNGAAFENYYKSTNSTSKQIPILVNTGDMTQNGTRINEWLDYYNAGKCLFNHLEQMNVVGNNDLCGTDPDILGTGDDIGKSNSFYFHLFYCYEVDPLIPPIVNNKYIPSLYYFDSKTTRYVMVNSEITLENCKNWFNLKQNKNVGNNIITVGTNIYTGFSIPEVSSITQEYTAGDDQLNFIPIYNQLYQITNINKEIIAVCHELPFTVITRNSLTDLQKNVSRSISNKGTLVGSHLNQLCPDDDEKGIYWFSRLMEHIGAKVVIGGHKHTYCCTYPLRENYWYGHIISSAEDLDAIRRRHLIKDANNKNPGDDGYQTTYDDQQFAGDLQVNDKIYLSVEKDGPIAMNSTLENDDIIFKWNEIDLSKRPLTKRKYIDQPQTGFYPTTPVENLSGGITYFMCQATGYKLTSNKELPSPDQKFSIIVPNTGRDSSNADAADDNQKDPMFAIINNSGIRLIKIQNIFNSNYKFSQTAYGNAKSKIKFLSQNGVDEHGTWGDTEKYLINF